MAIANAVAFLLYLCCSAILIRGFVRSEHAEARLSVPAGILTVLALLFHAADIFFTMWFAGGWTLNLATTLSMIAWLMALFAMLGGFKWPQAHPGIAVYPLVALILMFKVDAPSPNATALSDPALEWHILLSLMAYSLLTLAAFTAIVLGIQEKQLHRHNLSRWLRRLPPLQSTEKALFQLLLAGFVLLTLGLITGFIFLNDLFAQQLLHKTVLSIAAWLIFGGLLFGRWRFGWRSQTAVRWTLSGFVLLLLAYIGTKLIIEFLLTAN